jgi:hypothetical protein
VTDADCFVHHEEHPLTSLSPSSGHEGFRNVRCAHQSFSEYLAQRTQRSRREKLLIKKFSELCASVANPSSQETGKNIELFPSQSAGLIGNFIAANLTHRSAGSNYAELLHAHSKGT